MRWSRARWSASGNLRDRGVIVDEFLIAAVQISILGSAMPSEPAAQHDLKVELEGRQWNLNQWGSTTSPLTAIAALPSFRITKRRSKTGPIQSLATTA